MLPVMTGHRWAAMAACAASAAIRTARVAGARHGADPEALAALATPAVLRMRPHPQEDPFARLPWEDQDPEWGAERRRSLSRAYEAAWRRCLSRKTLLPPLALLGMVRREMVRTLPRIPPEEAAREALSAAETLEAEGPRRLELRAGSLEAAPDSPLSPKTRLIAVPAAQATAAAVVAATLEPDPAHAGAAPALAWGRVFGAGRPGDLPPRTQAAIRSGRGRAGSDIRAGGWDRLSLDEIRTGLPLIRFAFGPGSPWSAAAGLRWLSPVRIKGELHARVAATEESLHPAPAQRLRALARALAAIPRRPSA